MIYGGRFFTTILAAPIVSPQDPSGSVAQPEKGDFRGSRRVREHDHLDPEPINIFDITQISPRPQIQRPRPPGADRLDGMPTRAFMHRKVIPIHDDDLMAVIPI